MSSVLGKRKRVTTTSFTPRKRQRVPFRGKVPDKVKRYVKFALGKNEEDKVLTIPITVATIVAAGTPQVFRLSGVAQGVGDGQRIGDEIVQKKLELFLDFSNAGGSRSGTWRAIVFKYKVIDNAAPTSTDICGSVYSSISHDNRAMFTIVWDSGPRKYSDTGNRGFDFRKWLNLKRQRVDFSSAGIPGVGHTYLWLSCVDESIAQGGTGLIQKAQFASQLTYSDA